MSGLGARRVKALRKRAAYLEKMLGEGHASPAVLEFYANELDALEWALQLMEQERMLSAAGIR